MGAAPSPGQPGASAEKARLRASVRAARRRRTPQQRERDARALARTAAAAPQVAALPAGAVVAAYDSRPTEPGTRPLRAALRARGLRVLLPVVPAAPGPLAWVEDTGPDGPPDGPLGVPAGLAAAALVLLPALAVDAAGARLGQGGGHYDRALAALAGAPARPLLVAVVHDEELLARGAVPREAHDVLVDAVLTPLRWHRLPPTP
ncbi:5-formyltetrahydrofolate cyclo-ligase [Quadrisphaera sp. DSM 44207]|uniref:5-formyltetrahydrofolate cyclo-ligase n=1 Tax=Quadrisphaera sp. DSM 44207 TaxID=1881057 RepID=UPI00088E9617|nr:5-formyltetrahydrofolate cyclo-ligase [Quadrisphaera sp. DSM 44207]SDQ66222.1 5-formyltetrahydrofolate cyclo-ligase [Quadrisphaera sp. DSM 44207]